MMNTKIRAMRTATSRSYCEWDCIQLYEKPLLMLLHTDLSNFHRFKPSWQYSKYYRQFEYNFRPISRIISIIWILNAND